MNDKYTGGYSDANYKGPRTCIPSNPTKRRWLFWGVPIGLVIIAGIAIGAAVAVSKSNQDKTKAPSPTASSTGSTNSTGGATTDVPDNNFDVKGSGSDGSAVQMADGGSFTYSNSFGGTWAVDPYDPYSVSWT